jgi:hypothetical protein
MIATSWVILVRRSAAITGVYQLSGPFRLRLRTGSDPPGGRSRPHHFAKRDAGTYASAFGRSGKLHFAKPDIGGDHVVALLGPGVPDAHLAELAGDGYLLRRRARRSDDGAALFELVGRELGIKRLLVETAAT